MTDEQRSKTEERPDGGMRYDFDRIVDRRGTSSLKWDQLGALFGGEDVLPLFVADMDFEAPREVVEAIVARAKHGVYGYTIRTDSYYEAVTGWLERRHGWRIERDWLISSPGVVPALAAAILTFTEPGDGVILQSPVYYPFYDVIRANGRTVVDNPLRIEDGVYRIDFDLLEEQAKDAKLMLLCSPHNPGGRVWTAEELRRIGDICLRHGVIVVSDEIHHDLVFAPHKHVPFASLGPEYAERSVTCIAPSKTFNLAGLHCAAAIVPDDELRRRYMRTARFGLSIHMDGYFGVTGMEASYRYGEPWLEQLLVYLRGNRDALIAFLKERLPELKVMEPEGTYLAWVDCRAISEDPAELKKLMYEEARVAFSEGSVFGRQGAGWLRINFGCPRAVLIEALERFAAAARRRLDAR
jgi:cystathionine beta-lyase